MKKLLMMTLMAGAMGMGLGGCTEPIAAHQDEIVQPLQISFTEYWLRNEMAVTVLQPMRVGAGQARVVIQLRNKTDFPKAVDYKYYFVDERGVQVDNPSGWQLVKVPPRGTEQFEFVSMSPMARDFRVQLRPAQ
jgi:uncharacterized protein YcfL